MLHVAHEQRLPRGQPVGLDQFVNPGGLVVNLEIGVPDERVEPRRGCLAGVMARVHAAQHKGPQAPGAAELEELAGVGERGHAGLRLFEGGMEPGLELG